MQVEGALAHCPEVNCLQRRLCAALRSDREANVVAYGTHIIYIYNRGDDHVITCRLNFESTAIVFVVEDMSARNKDQV